MGWRIQAGAFAMVAGITLVAIAAGGPATGPSSEPAPASDAVIAVGKAFMDGRIDERGSGLVRGVRTCPRYNIRLAAELSPNIILMDVYMPGISRLSVPPLNE